VPPAADVRLERVAKSFDGVTRAVDGIDLAIAPGELFALLGPSGCGKTTTLRMIAGFEVPDEGRILVGGVDITQTPVHQRNMGMIFQSYALFPHRSVAQNVAFGLRMRALERNEIAARVGEALRLVALQGYEDRLPAQLSGGQQQRVALARAIVIRPSVLLCDEPLSALDRKLRQTMQFELKQLQQQLGVTLIFVTHDQEEAMTLADRIAVMHAGRIEQIATARDIYHRPLTRFVSDFIGEINLFQGEWREGSFVWQGKVLPAPGGPRSGGGTIGIRPERMRLTSAAGAALTGEIKSVTFVAGQLIYHVSVEGERSVLVKDVDTSAVSAIGTHVGIAWTAPDVVVLND
jgi:putative spermidine/putrescine transport system ATP-binding protein